MKLIKVNHRDFRSVSKDTFNSGYLNIIDIEAIHEISIGSRIDKLLHDQTTKSFMVKETPDEIYKKIHEINTRRLSDTEIDKLTSKILEEAVRLESEEQHRHHMEIEPVDKYKRFHLNVIRLITKAFDLTETDT